VSTELLRIEGEQELFMAFESLDEFVSDLRPVWPDVAQVVRAHAAGVFAKEGPGWPGLTEVYARRKAEEFGAQKLLHASGAYEASLTRVGAKYAIYRESPTSLTMGSRHPAALAHEEGAPSRGLPARPVFRDEDGEELEQKIAGVIERDLSHYAWTLGLAE
jgi:hypothetical protein